MWPHPRKIIFPDTDLQLITTIDEKTEILRQTRLDYLLILPFNQALAQTSYTKFIRDIIVDKINAKYLIVGYNHHFGKNREGNFDKLKQLSVKYSFFSERLKQVLLNNIKISSSEIRTLLLSGKVVQARNLLGRPFAIHGQVIKGKQLGHTIGFPTANIFINNPDKLIPSSGVYVVVVNHRHKKYGAMLNIGTNPTVSNDNKISIEVHIFNFDKDIYNEYLTIEFIEKIRNVKKFASLSQLKIQLVKDKNESTDILSKNKLYITFAPNKND